MLHRPNRRPQFFYTTAPLPCPYLAGRTERKIVTELTGPEAEALHDRLSRAGFRRSHNIAYSPVCPACSACVPIRILATQFEPNRAQRKLSRLNADITGAEMPARATAEQFALFQRYQRARHGDGPRTDEVLAAARVAGFADLVRQGLVHAGRGGERRGREPV